MFKPLKESVCQKPWQWHKLLLPRLDDVEFIAPKEIPNGMVGGRSDSEFVKKISKNVHESWRREKSEQFLPLDWLNPNGEKQKGNIN